MPETPHPYVTTDDLIRAASAQALMFAALVKALEKKNAIEPDDVWKLLSSLRDAQDPKERTRDAIIEFALKALQPR